MRFCSVICAVFVSNSPRPAQSDGYVYELVASCTAQDVPHFADVAAEHELDAVRRKVDELDDRRNHDRGERCLRELREAAVHDHPARGARAEVRRAETE